MARTKSKVKERANGLGTVTFDKSRGKWYARVLVGYAPETGKPRFAKRYAEGKTEAEQMLITLHTENRTGRLTQSKTMTLGEYLDSWLSALPPTLSPNTVRSYKENVKNHLKTNLGKRKLTALAPGDIEAMYRRLEDKGLSRIPSYTHRVLSVALTEAVRLGHLPKSPMERVRSPKVTIKRAERFHTAEETIKLLKHLETEEDSAIKVLMLLGIETGARLSELEGITWARIDLDRGFVAIQAQLARVDGAWALRPLKTGKSERIKILSPAAIKALKSERARMAVNEYKNPLGLALLNAEGRPWDHSHANQRIKAACKAAGVREFPSHTIFRHTYATALLKSGVSLHDASREMGHSNVSLTANLYGHHAMESTKKAAAARNAYLDDVRKKQATESKAAKAPKNRKA